MNGLELVLLMMCAFALAWAALIGLFAFLFLASEVWIRISGARRLPSLGSIHYGAPIIYSIDRHSGQRGDE